MLPSCFCFWVSRGPSKPSWFSQPFHKPHNPRCISRLFMMCCISFLTRFIFGTQFVPSPPAEPAKTRVWGAAPQRCRSAGPVRTRIHTKQSGKYALHIASSCLGKNISVMHNHICDVIFRISSQICPCKWNATGLLGLTANIISFGGFFSAHFLRKERQ